MTVPGPPGYPMSTRGWISVDYDLRIWIPCPPVFPDGESRQSWARLFAGQWWAASKRKHGEREVTALAQTLEGIHEIGYRELPMHNGFIHLPDLRLAPLLVGIGVWAAVGERDAQLRALVHADDPGAMKPPIIEAFWPARIDVREGPGLKVLAYTREGERITGFLSYAWRSDEHGTAVRMFTASPDLGRVEQALPDMERLANAVTIISRSLPWAGETRRLPCPGTRSKARCASRYSRCRPGSSSTSAASPPLP